MKAPLIWAAAGAILTIYLCTFHNAVNYTDDKWDNLYMDYVSDFRKSYASVEEFAARKEVFKANYLLIDLHNKDIEKTYELGLTQFSDWTQEEFNSLLKLQIPAKRTIITESLPRSSTNLAKDWEKDDKNKVQKVKDQGSCGSCWAFSAIAAIESSRAVAGLGLDDFAEQQLVDCSKNGNAGCNGGWMDTAFDWIQQNGISE